MNMAKSLCLLCLIGGILYLGSGCVGLHPESLDFFEASTDTVKINAVLGTVEVLGQIKDAENVAITEYGVMWSNNRRELEAGTKFSTKKSTDQLTPSPFSILISDLSLDSTYYFRAYAQAEGGRIALGNIISFGFSIDLEIIKHIQLNDTLLFEAKLSGFKRFAPILPRVSELGIILETISDKGDKLNIIERITPTSLVGDGSYTFKIDSTLFNKTYSTRFFVISGTKQWYSPNYTFKTEGGWKKLKNLDSPIYGAFSTGFQNSALVVAGYPKPCTAEENVEFSIYDPNNGGIFTHFTSSIPFERQYGAIFTLGNRIFGGFGENIRDCDGGCCKGYRCDLFEITPLNGQSVEISSCFPGVPRSAPAGFSVNGKGYVGLGRRGNEDTYSFNSDFWEFDPNQNKWRNINPLPIQGETVPENWGRQFPFVFQIDNRTFVGGGSHGAEYLNDIWEFIPPNNVTDKGTWKFYNWFPGTARDESFSLSLNGKGYLGLGYHGRLGYFRDFWQFDPNAPLNLQWKQLADFPGESRGSVIAFTLNGQIYVGGGLGKKTTANEFIPTYPTDFWTYIPTK